MKDAKTIFSQYLKSKGLLHTRQRDRILDIFLKTEAHPTINDLYDIVRKKNPKIGIATVYRAITVICNAGLARQVNFGDGQRRFEHKYEHRHHDHLVCLKCGRVIEVMSPKIEAIQDRLAKKHNFTPIRHRMQIFGTCSKCKQKSKKR